jgi:hypothetical protein
MANIRSGVMKAIKFILLLVVITIGSGFTGCMKVYTGDGQVYTEGNPCNTTKMVGRIKNIAQFSVIKIYPLPGVCFELKPGQRSPRFELTPGVHSMLVEYYRDNHGMAPSVIDSEYVKVYIDYTKGDCPDDSPGEEKLDFYNYWPGPRGVIERALRY